jgi:hypothetical protein
MLVSAHLVISIATGNFPQCLHRRGFATIGERAVRDKQASTGMELGVFEPAINDADILLTDPSTVLRGRLPEYVNLTHLGRGYLDTDHRRRRGPCAAVGTNPEHIADLHRQWVVSPPPSRRPLLLPLSVSSSLSRTRYVLLLFFIFPRPGLAPRVPGRLSRNLRRAAQIATLGVTCKTGS